LDYLKTIFILERIILIILIELMHPLTPDMLERALGLLGELLAARDHPPQHFVVCGGSSLLALKLVSRTTTQDVDILARVEQSRLVTPRPLPEWLIVATHQVGQQLGLPEGWFNDRVAEETLFHCGLPDGIESRLTPRQYGPLLRISFIGRRDQIFLKLHAAVDRDGGRHLQDLLELAPTAEEWLAAARWTRTQDPSQGFHYNLRSLLQQLGHENLASQL
jgi:hypothetical protein